MIYLQLYILFTFPYMMIKETLNGLHKKEKEQK
jgi:hypothetical protein